VAITTSASGTPAAEVSGNVELAPIADSTIIAENPRISIKKVEYYLNKKLIATKTNSPFTYLLDTKTMKNGEYTMVVKTSYSNGTVDTRTDMVVVKNKIDASYVARHYGVTTLATIAALAVFGGLIWKLVLPKFNFKHASHGSDDIDTHFGGGAGSGSGDGSGGGPDDGSVEPGTDTGIGGDSNPGPDNGADFDNGGSDSGDRTANEPTVVAPTAPDETPSSPAGPTGPTVSGDAPSGSSPKPGSVISGGGSSGSHGSSGKDDPA
jgi:hypothetical protein